MILKIFKIFAGIAVFANISIAIAADINHFNVTVNPEKVAVGEAVDLTIEAVDKNDEIIKDYEGSILIFSESDKLAQFPSSIDDNSYTFSKSDEGSVKFENSVKFSKSGKQDIHVYDLGDQTDSVLGLAEVEVTKKSVEENIDINILSPQNGLTIGEKSVTVSGKSKKNHQIKIVVNNKKETLTTTNRDGLYEKEVDGLDNGKNNIKAYVLNSDGKEIGSSKEVLITSDSNIPVFNKIKLNPENEVQVNTKILAEVYASKNLEEVSIGLNDGINILKEDTDGIYKGEFLAPKKEGDYNIDVLLKDELGHKVEKKGQLVLKVIPEIKSAEEPEKVVKEGKIKDKCKNGDFSGNVFDGKCGEKPEDYNAPIDLGIKNLKIVQLKTKSVLTWDKLEDAIKYEVYKKVEGDKLELIDTVKVPKYEVNMIGKNVKYEYFAVKAIGEKDFTSEKDVNKKIKKEIKGDLSKAVKIQTGPKEIILIIFSLIMGGFGVYLFSRKQA